MGELGLQPVGPPPPSLPLLGLSAERRNQYLQSILSLRRDLEDEDVLAER